MDLAKFSRRNEYSRKNRSNVSTDHLKISYTPSSLLSESRKYAQIQANRAFSTKSKNKMLSSMNGERQVYADFQRKSKSPVDNFSFFKDSRKQTPTVFKSGWSLNKLELARTGNKKNLKKLEKLQENLSKLLSLSFTTPTPQ